MSLHPNPNFVIPEETRRVAQAAFPKGTLCLSIAEVFGSLYHDDQFAALFPDHGQPATSPARLALVSVLQYVEGLSDRQAADAVRGHIDWKYALALELTDPGFDHTVLSEFRARLVEGRIEQLLLDPLTCPVNAVLAWVEAAMLTSGPLFRGVNRWNRPLPTRLSDKVIWRVVKKWAATIGKNPASFGAHSLRAGLITQATIGGATEQSIQEQTGHKSVAVLRRYVREASLFRNNAATKTGL